MNEDRSQNFKMILPFVIIWENKVHDDTIMACSKTKARTLQEYINITFYSCIPLSCILCCHNCYELILVAMTWSKVVTKKVSPFNAWIIRAIKPNMSPMIYFLPSNITHYLLVSKVVIGVYYSYHHQQNHGNSPMAWFLWTVVSKTNFLLMLSAIPSSRTWLYKFL